MTDSSSPRDADEIDVSPPLVRHDFEYVTYGLHDPRYVGCCLCGWTDEHGHENLSDAEAAYMTHTAVAE